MSALTEIDAARDVIAAAQALSFDLHEIEYCPVCDGHGEHEVDCTFSAFEDALDAYARLMGR